MFVHTLGHFFPARLCLDGSLTPSAGSLPSPIGRRRISTAGPSAGDPRPWDAIVTTSATNPFETSQ